MSEMVFLMPSAKGQGHLFGLYRASDGLREEMVCTSRNDVKDRLPEFDMVYFKRQFNKERRRQGDRLGNTKAYYNGGRGN